MIRLGVIGLGMAFEPHAQSLRDLAETVEVRWAASRSAERLEAARRHGFPVTTDISAVIADPGVDALLLLTPPDTHQRIGAEAIARGKHLLVEKPLDADLGRAAGLVAAAEAADVRLGVVLQYRFRPAFLRLHQILSEGSLGPVQFANVSVPWWRPQSYYDEPGRGDLARDGGGVLMTQAFHTLDLFRCAFGPVRVKACCATTTALHRMETEDHVCALLILPNGAPATLVATTANPSGRSERIEVVGELGRASMEGDALAVSWLDGRSEQVGRLMRSGSGAAPMQFSHASHRAVIADFCAAIEQDRPPAVTGEDALATQELIAALLQAAGPIVKL